MVKQQKFFLEWEKDINADGYIIKRYADENVEELVRIENIDITAVYIPNVYQNKEVHIKVCYFRKQKVKTNIYKECDYYCFLSGTSYIKYQFSTPKLVSIKQEKNNDVEIYWNKVAENISYLVIRKIEGKKWEKLGSTKETNYIDKHTNSGNKYIYSVRCVSDDGNVRLSGFSLKGISL